MPSIAPAAELGVDGHLLAGHRVEREARAHLGHALGPLGDDDELDDRQHEEDDRPDDVVAAHDERAERLDDLAGVRLEQDEARRGDVEREAEERRQEEQRRERRDADGVGHVEDDEQDGDGGREVGRDEEVERPRGQRDDHQPDDEDDQGGERDVRGAEAAPRAREGESERTGHGARLLRRGPCVSVVALVS